MKFKPNIKNLFGNLSRMLVLAWQMDKRLTFYYYLTAALGSFGPLISGLTLKYLIDNLQKNQTLTLINTIPWILIILLAVRYLSILIADIIRYGLNEVYFDYLFRYKLQNEFWRRFYKKVAELDIEHLEDSSIQNLISRTKDTIGWRNPDFLRMFRYLFASATGFTTAFLVLLPFGWWIPIVVTTIALPRMFLRIRYGTIEWSIYGANVPEVRKIWYLMDLMSRESTIKEIRIFRFKDILLKRLVMIQDLLLKNHKKPLDGYLKILTIPSVIETAVLFIIISFLMPNVLTGVLTIGSFALLISMVDQLSESAGGMVGHLAEVYEHNLYIQWYLDVMNLPRKVTEKEIPVIFESIKPPLIEFKNVSFKYPKGKLIIKNISFIVKPGENIAFVGSNGAGKSTIIKLICRFYDVTDGEILINGVNIKDLKLDNWYQFLGTLFQDFVRYQFTVRENISLAANEDTKKIKQAAKDAGIEELVEQLPNKYDQILGRTFDNGEELSVGQWQKVAIARAFYQAAPVLILDEPTSAIDAEAEYEIFNNLEKRYKDKTLIFVSHRFSTVRNADKILVIEDGQVIEEGAHQQLLKKNGKYAKMFKIQAEGYR